MLDQFSRKSQANRYWFVLSSRTTALRKGSSFLMTSHLSRWRVAAFSVLAAAALQMPCIAYAATDAGSSALAVSASTDQPSATAANGPSTQVSQNDLFSDVPGNSWAYDAVKQLVSDNIIEGYPDHTFKGTRPLTRYEMAVVIERAETAIRLKLAGGNAVSRADLEAVQKLQAEFSKELAALQKDVATLKTQTAANTAQLQTQAAQIKSQASSIGAISEGRKQQQFSALWLIKGGTLYNNTVAINGPTTLATTVGAVTPGNALPSGLGPTSTGLGAGTLTAGPNTYVTGPYQHGFSWQDIFPTFSGEFNDSGLGYYIRLESRQYFDQPNFLNSTIPAFCTSATPPAVGGCGLQDAGSSSFDFRFLKGYVSYAFHGGAYLRLGRYQQDTGRFNSFAKTLGGYGNGIEAGFLNDRWDLQGGYGVGVTSLGNLNLNGQAVTQAPGTAEAVQNLYLRGDYNWNKRTDLGFIYDLDFGAEGNYWNPSALLCRNAAASSFATAVSACSGTTPIAIATASGPVTGAYQLTSPAIRTAGLYATQYFGQNRNAKVTVEASLRLGNDPFTNQPWIGNRSFLAAFDIGGFSDGSRPARVNGTYVEGAFLSTQFYAQSPDGGPLGAFAYPTGILSNVGGYQIEWLAFEHYISKAARIGLVLEHFGLQPGTSIPLGSPTCPGCYIQSNNMNTVFLETALSF